jgi:YesN/AraC family two-component response regulator
MEIFIKNMVCIRCKLVVKIELEKLGIYCHVIELGRVDTIGVPSLEQIEKFRVALLNSGLELLESKRAVLIEKIKHTIIDMVYTMDTPLRTNFSNYLSQKLNFDYTYLANIFSETTGTTIEQFIIHHRIERAKELIWCKEFTLTEISWKLHFSSVAHLSSQFKKVTGFTPSYYKNSPLSSHALLQNV